LLILLVQLDILKKKRHGKVTEGILFLHNAQAYRTLATQKKLACLPGLPLSRSPTLFYGSGPVGLPPVFWTEKKILEVRHFSSNTEVIGATDTGWTDNLLKFFLVACES
jgi:hypothetical protein